MTTLPSFIKVIIVGLALMMIICAQSFAQSQASGTYGELRPELETHFQLRDNVRLLGFFESENGVDFDYRQLDTGLRLGYQRKEITKPHLQNIDPDKEYTLLLGGGYEYLNTDQLGKTKYENRMMLAGTVGFRPLSPLLIRDRNRVEFRWDNGVYSTRYRNQLTVEYDILIHRFRLTPYAAAEVYYDGAHHSWDEEDYSAGVQWPYKRVLMLDTYYLRQNSSDSLPEYVNVFGVKLNFYFGGKK